MLQRTTNSDALIPFPAEGGHDFTSFFDVTFLAGVLRRKKRLIAKCVGAFGALGLLFVVLTPASYKAATQVIIDPKRLDVFQKDSLFAGVPIDALTVESQVQVLSAAGIAGQVVDKLKLAQDPEFNGERANNALQAITGMVKPVIAPAIRSIKMIQAALLGPQPPVDEAAVLRQSIIDNILSRRLEVRRIGVSFVIEITFLSLEPSKAARIANAFASTYIEDIINGRLAASQRAGAWLEGRLTELRTRALEAEQSLMTFKNETGVGDGAGAARSEFDQQLTEIKAQLAAAQRQTLQTRTRLDQIDLVAKSFARSDATGIDSRNVDQLNSPALLALRQQYLDIASEASRSAAQSGEGAPATIELRRREQTLRENLQKELLAVQSSAQRAYDAAKSRDDMLRDNAQRLTQLAAGQRQAKLRELESSANTYRAAYDNFLNRYTQAIEQQSFPIAEARVVAAAAPPNDKFSPKTALILAIAIVFGSMVGAGTALAREILDRSVRTTEQLATAAGVTCLGAIPEVRVDVTRKVPPPAGVGAGGAPLFTTPAIMSVVRSAPFSRFAETVRSIKMAADVGHLPYRCRIIGVSSCIPSEGKTTIAANLAQLMAGGRSRVLLIDADLRNPMLSRTIAPDAKRGLADALRNPVMLPQLVLQHAECATLDFLPVTNSGQPGESYETLTSEQMRTLIADHTGDYQYIVLDLPPLAPVVDVRAASHLFDGLVLVTRWGTTTTSIIKKVLEASAGFNDKLLGAVLNCVDVTQLKQYENLDELYYNNKYYIQGDRVVEHAG